MEGQSGIKTVRLSRRLKQLAAMVSRGNSVADVGCDHGLLSVYLVQQGISSRVIAMDVRKGPLSGAREHVRAYGLEEYIELRLSDGLGAFTSGEADTLICAGMGGRLMQRILSAEPLKTRSFRELILQPQSELAEFRRFLRTEGYVIIQENILYEEGQYYFPIKAVYTPEAQQRPASLEGFCRQELLDAYGELLIRQREPVLVRYLEHRKRQLLKLSERLEGSDAERASDRLSEISRELSGIEDVLTWMET
ncbi:MAG: class I SAM-dependent methyltransferase [Roseburia sp.]|nr:class I SAM-dependent methyltransferase [Roseburia sp.]